MKALLINGDRIGLNLTMVALRWSAAVRAGKEQTRGNIRHSSRPASSPAPRCATAAMEELDCICQHSLGPVEDPGPPRQNRGHWRGRASAAIPFAGRSRPWRARGRVPGRRFPRRAGRSPEAGHGCNWTVEDGPPTGNGRQPPYENHGGEPLHADDRFWHISEAHSRRLTSAYWLEPGNSVCGGLGQELTPNRTSVTRHPSCGSRDWAHGFTVASAK